MMIGSPQDKAGAAITAAHERWNVREVRIRLPRAGISALKQRADCEGVTVNALIARYIDAGLAAEGRPGLFELASWFKDYLRRKGGRNSNANPTSSPDEDFT